MLAHQFVYSYSYFALEGHFEQISSLDQKIDVLGVLAGLPAVGWFLLVVWRVRGFTTSPKFITIYRQTLEILV